uniref:Calmodulin-lysine N-methyltransferase n=1 Tax=Physcomitrium patens TaxID=3218 RepID=A0A7I4B5A6_PHYPA
MQRTVLEAENDLNKVSRRPGGRFNVIQCSPVLEEATTANPEEQTQNRREVVARYTLPSDPNVVLTLRQRKDSGIDLSDFINSQKYDIDSTGLVCMWPAEEIMTYYCISRPELFRNKRVIELGSGYGLAGLAIAACSEASEVLLTDGNPHVVEYIQKNITANNELFGDTKVRTCTLHWSRHQAAMPGLNFDVVIAADCTFFKDFHLDLAYSIKSLLGTADGCQAILFNPRRGHSLDRFVRAAQSVELDVEIQEHYDSRIWNLHEGFVRNEPGSEWPNYDEDHCYPLLLSITHQQLRSATRALDD